MGLDLNKKRDRQPVLGRGRVPEDVKRRLQSGNGHSKTTNQRMDDMIARLAAKTRRLRKEGKSVEEELRQSLREVGGPWGQATIQAPHPAKATEWIAYLKRLDEDELLPEHAVVLRNDLLREIRERKYTSRALMDLSAAYNLEMSTTTVTLNFHAVVVEDETLRRDHDGTIKMIASQLIDGVMYSARAFECSHAEVMSAHFNSPKQWGDPAALGVPKEQETFGGTAREHARASIDEVHLGVDVDHKALAAWWAGIQNLRLSDEDLAISEVEDT